MIHVLECGVLLRMYTLFMSGLYAYAQLYAPETLMFKIAHADSLTYLTSWCLGGLAFLGFIDVFINDLLPERFKCLRALKDRHLVLMGIPVCFAIQMYGAVRHDFPMIILAYYGVYVVMVPASALSDINKRYKRKACT